MDTHQWFPVVTLVLGLILGYLGDWLRDERTSKRERETRRKGRQYETITETQDQMILRYRLEGGLAVLCQRYFDETGKWPDANSRAISYDLSSVIKSGEAAMRLVVLRSRIEDSELNRQAEKFVTYSTTMTAGPDTDTSRRAIEKVERVIHAFNERARIVLAELH